MRVDNNFMDWDMDKKFDAVIMNPPFGNGKERPFIKKALTASELVVCLMPVNAYKTPALKAVYPWVAQAKNFDAAFTGTALPVSMVVYDKHHQEAPVPRKAADAGFDFTVLPGYLHNDTGFEDIQDLLPVGVGPITVYKGCSKGYRAKGPIGSITQEIFDKHFAEAVVYINAGSGEMVMATPHEVYINNHTHALCGPDAVAAAEYYCRNFKQIYKAVGTGEHFVYSTALVECIGK